MPRCQEQQLMPIVEPQVLMNGAYEIERCQEITGGVLEAVFHALGIGQRETTPAVKERYPWLEVGQDLR
jgi:fructose-bisphosphate aldolase class 1